MTGTIFTDESNLAVFYRLTLPGAYTLVFFAIPLTPDIGAQIIGSVNEDYTLIGTLRPTGVPFAFLQRYAPTEGYVAQVMQLPEHAASLMAALIPKLTLIPPADDLLAIAEAWGEKQLSRPIP